MWVNTKEAPKFVTHKAALMTHQEEKAQFKLMQQEEGLDEEVFKAKMQPSKLKESLGGEESAYMGTLMLAQQLQAVKSKYPLVVLTNDPKLLDIAVNDSKKEMYSNV